MSVVRWRRLSIPLLLGALLTACADRDPLAPSFAVSKSGAPTSLTATAVSHEQINLAWQDNATNESGWEVHRSTTGPTGTFTLYVQYPWPNVTSAGYTGLQPATQYCFKVRSFKGSGRRGSYTEFSNVACATTQAAPVPAAPSGVRAAPSFFARVDVSWTDNSANETGFRVERSATSSGPWTTVGTAGANVTSLADNQPPSAEQPACYRVLALSTFGDSPPSNVHCTSVPNAPSGLTASATGSNIDLTWTDNSEVEDGYEVHRWTASSPIVVVATVSANATVHRDAGLPDNTYYYQVRATKDGGTSGGSNNAVALVATSPPNAPSSVNAVPSSSSVIELTWTDESANEEGFRIERSIDGGATWVLAATAGQDQSWHQDLDRPSEQQACYRVIAFNALGESLPSNTDCTTPPAAPSGLKATSVDATTIDFAWTDNSAVEDGYLIGIDYGFGYWDFVAFAGPNATSYRFEAEYAYYNTYFIVAMKDGGYSDWSNVVYPTPPTGAAGVRTGPTPSASAPRPSMRTRTRGEP